MTRADIVAGLLLAAFFGAALWEGSTFQYGAEFAPGPGFAPVWLSAIGIVLSLLIVVFGWRVRRRPGHSPKSDPDALDRSGLLRVGATVGGLVAMLAIVPWLGLLPSILAFLLYLTIGVQRLTVATGIGASVVTVAFVYVVFVRLLDVPVPHGPLGF